ncbi:hypothetical protein KEF85_06710 [Methylomonas paludis]|uniref:Uncharacterized protein n=1 Tax=Methylomonas paludis TaxID=1173101 RepID=A0A975MQY6_9GAMM|nr:hypothetical protein [Methylomonas paludis]QWF72134.1 hypothetical protein KEF85_06710 [Methylomonas paludis]
MTLIDDGDLIRGLGFVTLYAAHLEKWIDECIKVIIAHDAKHDNRLYRQPTSKKIDYIQQQLQKIVLIQELKNFPDQLQIIGELLEKRNLIIHSCVYATNVGDIRISGRPGVPESPAKSAEHYELANDLDEAITLLYRVSKFSLPRQFNV